MTADRDRPVRGRVDHRMPLRDPRSVPQTADHGPDHFRKAVPIETRRAAIHRALGRDPIRAHGHRAGVVARVVKQKVRFLQTGHIGAEVSLR
jgi:hypothetical protein